MTTNGHVKNHKMGRRTVGKGAGVGLVLAMLTPVGLGAAVAGGAIGALHRKRLGIRRSSKTRSLPSWPAARPPSGSSCVRIRPLRSVKSSPTWGTTQTVEVPAEAMDEAEAAAPQVEQEEVAAGDDLSIIDGIGSKYADTLKAGGVRTFTALGAMSSDEIESQLADAGNPLIAGHNAAYVASPGPLRREPGLVGPPALHRFDEGGLAATL